MTKREPPRASPTSRPTSDRFATMLGANVDLALVLLLCVAMGAALLAPALPLLRLPLALLFVLVLPGYLADVALWPEREAQDFTERSALAVALSVVLVSLVGLGLNVSPWGIGLRSLYLSLTAFMLVAAAVSFVRRQMTNPAASAQHGDLERVPRARSRWSLPRTAGLAAVVLVLTGATALAATRRPQERLTEFSILDTQGTVANYPTQAQAGETITLPATVVNHEGADSRYQVVVQTGGAEIGSTDEFVLADGRTWSGVVSFTPRTLGPRQEVDLLLLKDDTSEPYRRLTLWLGVVPVSPTATPSG